MTDMTKAAAEVDAKIAKAWPNRWAKANDPNLRGRSKARQQLRRAWRRKLEFEAFKAANPDMSCFNCQHREKNPTTMPEFDWHCAMGQDGPWYSPITEDRPCTDWRKQL